jgi:hypothetical protein
MTTPQIITVDELSHRLKRVRLLRFLQRCDKLESPFTEAQEPKRQYAASPQQALKYFNKKLDLGLMLNVDQEEQACCLLYDLVTLPLDMVHNRVLVNKA